MNPFLQGLRPDIHGSVDPAFAQVREVFEANFFERGADGEVGASCHVMVDGRTVVDLYGGYAEPEAGRRWERNTIACSWSVGKAALTTLGLMLVDQGKLELDAPVCRYWPEFGQNGKEGVLVRHLFDHRCGVSYVDAPLQEGDLYDWDTMVRAIEQTSPNFPPGSQELYLNMTHGYLLGELFRRVNGGRRIAQFLREELSGPLDLDWQFALSDADIARTAKVYQKTPAGIMQMVTANPDTVFARSMRGFRLDEDFNTLAWRKAEIGSGSIHGNARSLARMWSALVRGGELGVPIRFSTGYEMNCPPAHPMGPNPDAFGFWGAGGVFGFADPATLLSFGYSMNYMHPALELGPRGGPLVDAAVACESRAGA
jgi:CubicO group peptidase (beta-lactamase class C family)